MTTEERPCLKRKLSSSDQPTLDSIPSFSTHVEKDGVWTTEHWKKLEDWYIQKDRDYLQAAIAFHHFECRGTDEYWPLDILKWKSKCLDTNARAHAGLLPSQRKKKRITEELFKTPQRTTPHRTPNLTPTRTPNRIPSFTATDRNSESPSRINGTSNHLNSRSSDNTPERSNSFIGRTYNSSNHTPKGSPSRPNVMSQRTFGTIATHRSNTTPTRASNTTPTRTSNTTPTRTSNTTPTRASNTTPTRTSNTIPNKTSIHNRASNSTLGRPETINSQSMNKSSISR